MKKVGTLVLCAVAIIAVVSWKVAPVQAYPEFYKEFEKKYTKETPSTPDETKYKETITTTKCGVCHTGKTKKVRNTYGVAIGKLIPGVIGVAVPTADDKKDLKKNTVKIESLLDKAADEHSDPEDPKSPTFGDLIKEGKLPGKDLPAPPDAAK